MPLTEIEGYCLYAHELFWTWRLIVEGPLNILASLLISLVPGETEQWVTFCSTYTSDVTFLKTCENVSIKVPV